MGKQPYNRFSAYLKREFGYRVRKIAIDPGLTCPNRDGTKGVDGCIFCDADGSGPGPGARSLSVEEQIAAFLSTGKPRKDRGYLAYFQAFSSTHTEPETLWKLLCQALGFEAVVGVAVGTRPDCLSEPILDILSRVALRTYCWLEIGLQSASQPTLEAINRRHSVEDFRDAVVRAHARGLRVCAHVILGLPGEGPKEFHETAALITSLGIEGVKIHPLHVLKGTRLHDMYQRGAFSLLSKAAYASAVSGFLERIPESVVIQRLTGERSPDILVAPSWCLDKHGVLRAIEEALDANGTYQGRLC